MQASHVAVHECLGMGTSQALGFLCAARFDRGDDPGMFLNLTTEVAARDAAIDMGAAQHAQPKGQQFVVLREKVMIVTSRSHGGVKYAVGFGHHQRIIGPNGRCEVPGGDGHAGEVFRRPPAGRKMHDGTMSEIKGLDVTRQITQIERRNHGLAIGPHHEQSLGGEPHKRLVDRGP